MATISEVSGKDLLRLTDHLEGYAARTRELAQRIGESKVAVNGVDGPLGEYLQPLAEALGELRVTLDWIELEGPQEAA